MVKIEMKSNVGCGKLGSFFLRLVAPGNELLVPTLVARGNKLSQVADYQIMSEESLG
jgi:hypothetical protein